MMSDVLKRLQTLKVFFRLLLKYVILLQVWKLYVIQCLPNGIAKNLSRCSKSFLAFVWKTGQKTKEAFDKIDTVLLKSAKKSKGNEFEFECKLYTKLLLVF